MPWATMLSMIVAAIAFTTERTCGLASPSSSTASNANTTDANPLGPNQPTNATVARSWPAPMSEIATGTIRTTVRLMTAYSDGLAVEMLEHRKHETSTEDEPQGQRKEASDELGELGALARVVACGRAEHQPADERGDERVATHFSGDQERDERQGKRGESSRAGVGPASLVGDADQKAADEPGPDADAESDRDLSDGSEPVTLVVSDDPERRCRCCDAHRHHGSGDAVVEPALDVQHPPDAGGQTLVGDDRRARGRRRSVPGRRR